MEPRISEQVLDERLAALEAARSWSPRVISKLESHVRGAEDAALFRINPIRFAAAKGIAEPEAIDLFLHAASLGLVEMDWLLVCPMCACLVESFRSLQSMHNHYHCSICNADYEAALDDNIMIAFTVSPAIRPIDFHHPKDLPVGDYVFRCRMAADAMLPDGTPWVEALQTIMAAISYLPAGAVTRLEAVAEEGLMFGWDVDSNAQFLFEVTGPRTEELQVVPVRYRDGVCEPPGGEIAPGPVVFEVENVTDRRGMTGIVRLPADFSRRPLPFAPFLTGKRLLTSQTFRNLFRSEVIRATEGIGVKDITLLFTDLKGSTALYDRIGDLNAFSLVQQHFEHLHDVTARHGGAIIKTIGDAVMAAFLSPADAVRAGLAMLKEIDAFNRGQPNRELILKIGMHTGAAIAVTLNDRLDYFGQTVNIAARVQGLADAGEIYLTSAIFEAPGVKESLASNTVEPRVAQLKGVDQEISVFRIAARSTAESSPRIA